MDIPSFSELLRDLRQRRRLSQRALAEQLGVHHNTVWAWEQGNYLPASKGLVVEIARLLHLGDAETRQLLDASLTTLSLHWSVPGHRNPFFTGRETILTHLYQRLRPAQDSASARTPIYALQGLAGIGKTQIALEYAYRYSLEYSAIFWIEAGTLSSILMSMSQIATHLQFPEQGGTNQQQMVVAVHHWLATNWAWLLIWDNVEDPELFHHFLPSTLQGAILITTRRLALGTLTQSIELSPMMPEEGAVFVLRRAQILKEATIEQTASANGKPLPPEWGAAQKLVRMMGGLPLALDQAGAYIEETGCGLSGFLQRYEQQRAPLLDRRGSPGRDHPHSITTTLLLAYAQVRQQYPRAADLLCLCAFLSPESIPEEFFVVAASHPGGVDAPFATDLLQFDLMIATLRNFSLVQRNPEMRTISLHRLVQTILQDALNAQERARWQQCALLRLHTLFPEVSYRVWAQCERLLPHVLTSAANPPDGEYNKILAELLLKAADYLRERERHTLSEQLYQQALCILEQEGERDHSLLAQTLHGLALLASHLGRYKQAKLYYERALHLREQLFGPDHPLVAQSLKVLGTLYANQEGRYRQAETLYQQALSIRERAFGPEHPLVAELLNNLAEISRHLGNYPRAEALFERALRVWTEAYGPDALERWYALDGLATLKQEQGQYEQAKIYHRQTLRLIKRYSGSEALNLAYPLSGLAQICCEQGRYEKAERFYHRALALRERNLGHHHVETAQLLSGIARLYLQQKKDEQAEIWYQKALDIQECALGPDHPEVAKSLVGLVSVYAARGRHEQAIYLLQRAYPIFQQCLGQAHPETLHAANLLIQYAEACKAQP